MKQVVEKKQILASEVSKDKIYAFKSDYNLFVITKVSTSGRYEPICINNTSYIFGATYDCLQNCVEKCIKDYNIYEFDNFEELVSVYSGFNW